jgi:Secretion system C-terminal sorting domain
MKNFTYLFVIVFVFSGFISIGAREYRVGQVPNGSKLSCNTCHTSGGGTPRNDFGKLVEKSFLEQAGNQFNVTWGPLLASLDADNDGVTNGHELQDPYGVWSAGQAAPGLFDMVTSAGLSNSNPLSTLTVNFTEMTPHIDQSLWLRVYDKTNMKEVGRTSVTVTENFAITLDVLLIGHNYIIDFFADHNSNGIYDSPTEDHAWRLELENALGNDVLDFAHNTNFIDIEWPYLLSINFSEMDPHIGQLLEVRVEDDLSSEEIGRKRIEIIPAAQFTVEISGIEIGKEYNVEMYADHNANGIYDEPPSDHAWEVKFENNIGDFMVDFAHNKDFKDVGWKYLYTLNFVDLAPHVNQLLEMRVVRNDNSEEVNRTSVIVPGSVFTLSIPQIEMDHDYNVEFYADHNGNGLYDAPPTDHAWRLAFNSNTGNFVQNFSHNSDFVDIGWTNVTNVANNKIVPNSYVLYPNYPNPFNPSTTISFNLEEIGNVSLVVYDILGQKVSTLIQKEMSAGLHNFQFEANNLESGTYYYRLKTNKFKKVRKMVILK